MSVVAESISLSIALKEVAATKGTQSLWRAVHTSKNPAVFVVLVEDSTALAGLVVAFCGVFFGHPFHKAVLDGIASLVIGGILAAVAVLLAYESKELLVGESATAEIVQSIQKLAMSDPAVERIQPPLTIHFGPHDVLLNMVIQFHCGLSGAELVTAVERLEQAVRAKHPSIKRIFIEAEAFSRAERQSEARRDTAGVEP